MVAGGAKKKPAAAPFAKGAGSTAKGAKKPVVPAKNPLIVARPRIFGVGQALPPKRDVTRYVKWPKNVRLQRQRKILYQRLKVPPAIQQFHKDLSLSKDVVKQLFKLLDKYRPETKKEKAARLVEEAKTKVAGADKKKDNKKPIHVKYGLNHVTALVEAKKAKLVVIAADVDPIELVVWLPALCRKMKVPYAIIRSKALLGQVVHKKTAAAIALTATRPEDKQTLDNIIKAADSQFADNEDARKHWGGGIMGARSVARSLKREKTIAKERAGRPVA